MRQRLDGVVLLDKPLGMSSQGAVTAVKCALNADKAGHTGTLDPMATGLLPICLGEATKYSQDLLDADKRYIARVRFGANTDTGDAEGQIVTSFPLPQFADAAAIQIALNALLPAFTGPIMQVPPMYSALKRDGKPLYEYARAGVELERTARDITIHSIRWIAIQWPEATLEVSCSKGTYIRVLAEDIGKAHKFAIEGFAEHLVPVADSLYAALNAEAVDAKGFKEGLEITLKQLMSAFEKGRLVEINPASGDKFDPHHHQAISMVPSDQEPGTVVSVLQRGYSLADRVLRPALVTVSQSA